MLLLNEMTVEELQWREREKRFCGKCKRWVRERGEQCSFTIVWNGDQLLPPRRFVNALMRVIEEIWICPNCPTSQNGIIASGLWIDFEHIGSADELVLL